jgi:hypothetical protein
MNIKHMAAVAFGLLSTPAFATTYTGTVTMLEVWENGNIAFTLGTSTPTCNGQFILNASAPGAKNQYAAVLTAKSKGSQITVYASGNCIAADGLTGGSSYNESLYVYVLDN